jgi:hypothetical protein
MDARSAISSPTFATSSSSNLQDKKVIRDLYDANGNLHCLFRYKVTKDPSGRQRTKMRKMRKCKLCIMKNT